MPVEFFFFVYLDEPTVGPIYLASVWAPCEAQTSSLRTLLGYLNLPSLGPERFWGPSLCWEKTKAKGG